MKNSSNLKGLVCSALLAGSPVLAEEPSISTYQRAKQINQLLDQQMRRFATACLAITQANYQWNTSGLRIDCEAGNVFDTSSAICVDSKLSYEQTLADAQQQKNENLDEANRIKQLVPVDLKSKISLPLGVWTCNGDFPIARKHADG